MNPIRILAINPGAKYLGISIFYGSDLREWCIKAFKGRWSTEKMEKIIGVINELIEEYEINALAIKKLHPARSSVNLNLLVRKIKKVATKYELLIYQYSINELKKFFSPEMKINKQQLVELMVTKYPALYQDLTIEKCHKNPYRIRIFEAIALGSRCFQQLDKR